MDRSFDLSIRLENDAMQTAEDVAQALERVAAKLAVGITEGPVRDVNGNTVGSYSGDFTILLED